MQSFEQEKQIKQNETIINDSDSTADEQSDVEPVPLTYEIQMKVYENAIEKADAAARKVRDETRDAYFFSQDVGLNRNRIPKEKETKRKNKVTPMREAVEAKYMQIFNPMH